MIHWFKKHPKFLRTESYALSHDSNYKELFQKRDQLFVSHGQIMVRLDKVYKYPIVIVYSYAAPYILPNIYPLNRQLTEQEVEQIASDYNYKIPEDAIQFYPNLRHQNGSGTLCFLEWDAFETGGQFFGITSIISRVKDWYKAHTTGEFPPDSQEVALFAHSTKINNQFQILYPDAFIAIDDIVQGEFYASEYFLFAKNSQYSDIGSIFLGFLLTGVTQSGLEIDIPAHLNISEHIREAGLATSLDLQTKPLLVKRLVEDGQLIEGMWFDISFEPSPFQNFSDLISIIGNNSTDAGLSRLTSIGLNRLKPMPNELLIGLRFFNRKGQKEFHAFAIKKVSTENIVPPRLFGCEPIEIVKDIVENYKSVEAIYCEKFSEETFFQRNAKRADRTKLKDCKVNILGVGALGGEIADSIGKAGVGKMLLIDNQRINAHNVVRHIAGLRKVGYFKADAVGSVIKEHNPFVEIITSASSVTGIDIGTNLPEESISISSIADDNVESFINEQLVVVNRPVFYSRALRGGKVGRIMRVIPGKDACLNCLRLYREEKGEFIEVPVDDDYPTLRNECNNPILPASAADLKIIAAITSRLVIDHLQIGAAENNHWLWSSEVVPNTPLDVAYSTKAQFFPPHANCQFCNRGKTPLSVNIIESALDDLTSQVLQKKGTETGGVLAGYVDEHGNITILFGSGPGPKAIETATRFEKDVEFCQKFLDELQAQHGEKGLYLGEWHSHPNENNTPSNTDLKSLTDISYQKDYLTDQPIMIIFSSTGASSGTIHPAGKSFRNVELLPIKDF